MDDGGGHAREVVLLGESLSDKCKGEGREGAEERAVKGIGIVGAGEDKADDRDRDRKMLPISEKVEGAEIECVAQDMLFRVLPVIFSLEIPSLLVIKGRNLFLKKKIMLEKSSVIHYSKGCKRQGQSQAFCVIDRKGQGRGGRGLSFFYGVKIYYIGNCSKEKSPIYKKKAV